MRLAMTNCPILHFQNMAILSLRNNQNDVLYCTTGISNIWNHELHVCWESPRPPVLVHIHTRLCTTDGHHSHSL